MTARHRDDGLGFCSDFARSSCSCGWREAVEGDVVDGGKCGLSFEGGKCEWRQMGRFKRTGLQTWQLSEELQSVGRGNLQNSKREEPEKSQVNGGNLNELSDRRTDRKEKKLRKTRNGII